MAKKITAVVKLQLPAGKATPFEGWKVFGRCMATVCDGKVVYKK